VAVLGDPIPVMLFKYSEESSEGNLKQSDPDDQDEQHGEQHIGRVGVNMTGPRSRAVSSRCY
jgi:hypothetical protein